MKRLIGLLAATLLAAPAYADDSDKNGAYFRVSDGVRLPLEETSSKVVVAGVIAHVRQKQVYTNEGSKPIEATYVFSGSTRAALFAMEMKVGARTIVADVAKRGEARRRYETAKKDGRTASLLEQHRPNVFSMNVANILPGDRIEVRIDYTELLVPEEGVYELVLPGVVEPRFDGEASRTEAWNENPHLEGTATPHRAKWSASVRIAGGLPVRAVRSPSHRIAPHFDSRRTVNVDVVDTEKSNRDFILRYRLDDEAIQTGVLLYEGAKEKFFTAIVQPPKRVAPSIVPPREYQFVVDVSGSMSGFPIETAQRLMRELLAGLREQDRFNVVLFAGDQRVLSSQSVPATPENVREALAMVSNMRGGGGTRLLRALDRAFDMPRADGISTTMVVVTDGFVTVEAEAYEKVRNRLGTANLFAFGIGRSVNRHLVQSLARAGLGRPFVVTQPSEAAATAARFAKYVAQPVMTNVKLEIEGLDAYDVSRKHIPDLFGERPIVVFGKYRGQAEGSVRVTGVTGETRYDQSVSVRDADVSDDLVALRYLWARDRIAQLSDVENGSEGTREQITKLGLRYHLMTKYTSFVAVDDGRRHYYGDATRRAPKGMGETTVTYPMNFMATGAGRGGSGSLGVRGSVMPRARSSAMVMGSLSKNEIQRVIRRHQVKFKRVYERALQSNPNLKGKVVLELIIGADGRVTRARIVTSTIGDKKIAAAMLRIAKKMRFPKPAGGGTITVRYPFVFSPG